MASTTSINIPIEANIGSAPMDLGSYFTNIIGVALTVAAVATFGYLVWGGIQWITAGGAEKKIEEAKERITGAIVGLAIVAISWAVFLIVNGFFGLNMVGNGSSSKKATSSSSTSTSTSALISYICLTESDCNKYCPNSNYATVKSTKASCASGKIGCACISKDNSKIDTLKNTDGVTVNN